MLDVDFRLKPLGYNNKSTSVFNPFLPRICNWRHPQRGLWCSALNLRFRPCVGETVKQTCLSLFNDWLWPLTLSTVQADVDGKSLPKLRVTNLPSMPPLWKVFQNDYQIAPSLFSSQLVLTAEWTDEWKVSPRPSLIADWNKTRFTG